MINSDYRQQPDTRRFNYNFTYREHEIVDRITVHSCVRISTKPGISPQYMVELNFIAPGGKQPPLTIFETNPNNYDRGWHEVQETVDSIFAGFDALKVTRMDLNAETDQASVHYFKDSLRLPGKRADAKEGKRSDSEQMEWWRAGIETLRYGKAPSQLQIYDKIQELKFKRADYVERLPQTLTRLEFRLTGIRCPIEHFPDIPKLLPNCQPFAAIQLWECPEYYDYKVDPQGSLSRLLFNTLRVQVGQQEAVRYLNKSRHFARNFKEIVVDNNALKAKIQESYEKSNRRLLSGKGASVRHMFIHCAWCNLHGVDVKPCGGCGVRLCFECIELNEGHESTCPKRKESHDFS